MQVAILYAARALLAAGTLGHVVDQIHEHVSHPRLRKGQRRPQSEVVARAGNHRDAGKTPELDGARAVDLHGDNYRALTGFARCCQTTTRRPRCSANGSKSLSLCSKSYRLSMHRVAITVSMVLRAVTPSLRSARKFFAA